MSRPPVFTNRCCKPVSDHQYFARYGLSRLGRNWFRAGRRGLCPLRREDRRRAVAQRAVRAYLVVILPPALELVIHVGEREEYDSA